MAQGDGDIELPDDLPQIPDDPEGLFQLLLRIITPAVRWIGYRVLAIPEADLSRWATLEAAACAALIRNALLQGCDCWERWEDFHIESRLRAVARCQGEHNLENWVRTEPLVDFLFRAAIKGNLRLPDGEKGEQALVNDFRKGMLAKCVADQLLEAGPVPKCQRTGCHGEIQNDRCTNCGEDKGFRKPTWWLWVKGHELHRTAAAAEPATGCSSFRGSMPRVWSDRLESRPTKVWIPVEAAPLHQQAPGGDQPPDQRMLDQETLEKLQNGIERLEEPERTVARQVLLEGWMIADAAEKQDLEPTDRDFKEMISSIVRELGQFLGDTDDFS